MEKLCKLLLELIYSNNNGLNDIQGVVTKLMKWEQIYFWGDSCNYISISAIPNLGYNTVLGYVNQFNNLYYFQL